MIEALAEGGVNMQMRRDLAAQTELVSDLLVPDSKQHPGQLKDDLVVVRVFSCSLMIPVIMMK